MDAGRVMSVGVSGTTMSKVRVQSNIDDRHEFFLLFVSVFLVLCRSCTILSLLLM